MFFEYPYLLWLLAIPVLLILRYVWIELKDRRAHMRVSALEAWKAGGRSVFEVLRQQGARVVSLMTQFGEGETRQVYIRLQQPESEERARAIRSALEAQWKLLEWTVAQG